MTVLKNKIFKLGLIVIVSILFTSCYGYDKNRTAQKLGIALPTKPIPANDIKFQTLQNKTVKLSDYRGKVILLNLWASWCPPCRMEMPSMETLYRHFKQDDFVMIALNVEQDIENTKLMEYARENGYTFTIGVDKFADGMSKYYTGSTPISYIIGKDFNIEGRLIGTTDWGSIQAIDFITHLINENSNK